MAVWFFSDEDNAGEVYLYEFKSRNVILIAIALEDRVSGVRESVNFSVILKYSNNIDNGFPFSSYLRSQVSIRLLKTLL